MHSASLDVVRKALAVLKFISLGALIYLHLLCSYFIASIQTGVSCSRRGDNVHFFIVFSASCLSPHDILADLDKL